MALKYNVFEHCTESVRAAKIRAAIYASQYIAFGICDPDTFSSSLVPSKLLLHFNKSIVLSPLLLRLPLCKLACVAQGEVKAELLKALGYKNETTMNSSYRDLDELLTHLKRIDFAMVNHIYLNYSKDYKDTLLKPAYGVDVQKVSFNYPVASSTYINKMIDRVTYKRLSDVLVKDDITKETSMLLINAVYLTATWEVPFNIVHTKHNMKFRRYNQSIVLVPMMYKSEDVLYVDDDLHKIKVINMKLASPGVSMTFVIPENKKSLQDFLGNLVRPTYFNTIKKRMRIEFLNVAIPRFKLKTLVDWTDSLHKVLNKLFERNSTGLNNMLTKEATNKHLHISKVKQKNFIEVNEMGAYRIITTELPYKKLPHLRPTLEAVADRPFYFSVSLHYDSSNYWNMEELFAGVYYGPDT